jgi:hypothetical protein
MGILSDTSAVVGFAENIVNSSPDESLLSVAAWSLIHGFAWGTIGSIFDNILPRNLQFFVAGGIFFVGLEDIINKGKIA